MCVPVEARRGFRPALLGQFAQRAGAIATLDEPVFALGTAGLLREECERRGKQMKTQKVRMVFPGCAKNTVDAEVMLGALQARGYERTADEKEADVIIVTTCSFVKAARHVSIGLILDSAELKETGRCHTLVVAGCFVQRYKEELAKLLPEVDLFIGTSDYPDIANILDERESTGRQVCRIGSPDRSQNEDIPRLNASSARHAYLKIGEGCSSGCTYCIIPQLRGRQRSRPLSNLVAEAEKLVSEGVNELVVISQDPTKYGEDLTDGPTLVMLLRRLAAIDGLEWIWLQYVNPDGVSDDLISLIRDEPKIRKFLSVQIQHISDPVLKRMNRGTTAAEIKALIRKLRQEIPALVLGTCAIVGFPGETEDDYHELMRVVEEGMFDFMSVFPYSPEEGTPAARMRDQIHEEIRKKRYVELSQARAPLWPNRMRAFFGTTLELIVEGYIAAPPEVMRSLRKVGPDRDVPVSRADREAGGGRGTRLPVVGDNGPPDAMVEGSLPGNQREDPDAEYSDVYTLSESLPDGLAEHIRLERNRKLFVAEIPSFKRSLPALDAGLYVSGRSPLAEKNLVLAGRSSFQIPGQDSKTYLANGTAAVGDIVKVKILGMVDYDLIGTVVPQGEDRLSDEGQPSAPHLVPTSLPG